MTHLTHTIGCSCNVELQLLPARRTCSTLHIGAVCQVHFALRLASTFTSLGNHPDGLRARPSYTVVNLKVLPAGTSRFRRPTSPVWLCDECIMRLRRCAHGNLLCSTHEGARMRCMGGLTAAHLRPAALSCSRCERRCSPTPRASAARQPFWPVWPDLGV